MAVDTPVEIVETFDNRILIKYRNKYYKTRLFKHGKSTAHTPPTSHPWKQNYGKKIKDQK